MANRVRKNRAVVVFSGGPDSTAAALWAVDQGFSVQLLTFRFFGEEQEGELQAAASVAKKLRLPQLVVDLQALLEAYDYPVKPLMHGGSRGAKRQKNGSYMPFGAPIALSVAASIAVHKGVRDVIWGATKDDQVSRVEYSLRFGNQLGKLLSATPDGPVRIHVPFSGLHKFEVLKAFKRRIDLFAMTWSCASGGRVQSGDDHASTARRIAAKLAGIEDLTNYVNKDLPPLDLKKLKGLSPKELGKMLGSEKAHDL